MSPVSRGRKPKKSSKPVRAQRRSRPVRPDWFESATKAVLAGAGSLDVAGGPRELEQRTAELLGAELHRVLQEGHSGLRFAEWFDDVVEQAAGVGTSMLRLLTGMTAIGTSALASVACLRVRKLLKDADHPPDWLDDLSSVTATGDVFRMRDAYGNRFAVLAEYSYGREPSSVFLFDIDAAGIVTLAGAGVFDDVDQAAAAWLAERGDAAGDPVPQPVVDPRDLLCLVHWDIGGTMVMGDEPRAAMDNWFRARRRQHDLAEALRRRGLPLPVAESRYHGLDVAPLTAEFTAWHIGEHGVGPDAVALAELAAEWLEGGLPETRYAVSPGQVAFVRALVSDWVADDPITLAVRSLLPDWVRWLAERAGLPAHLRARVDAAAR